MSLNNVLTREKNALLRVCMDSHIQVLQINLASVDQTVAGDYLHPSFSLLSTSSFGDAQKNMHMKC
jgi:hypothetical protein